MTKKKKVKFQVTHGEEEEQLYNRNQTEPIMSKKSRRFKENHSLDSDEEFDEEDGNSDDKQNVLHEDDIEGQEDETILNEQGITITPFNLREELEEGHFDVQGNYIANKDPDATDQWLESADWDKIENQSRRVKKEVKMEEEDTILLPRHKIMQDMVSIMKPGENVLKCLRRLGGNKNPLSSADRWKKKKLLIDEPVDEKALENKANLLKLTGLADDLLQGGDYQIYERTYEQLSYEIKSKLSQFEDAEEDEPLERPLKKPKIEGSHQEKKNIESDEDDELEAAFKNKPKNENDGDPTKSIYLEEEIEVKSVFGISKDKVIEKTNKAEENILQEISWIYKLTDDENSEHLGPFTSTEMLKMHESGKFGDGVYCRKVGNEGSFYTSKRIDFDLYT